MTKEISNLIDVAIDVQKYFGFNKFSLHVLDGFSYVDFIVYEVYDLPALLNLCSGHDVVVYARDEHLVIKISITE